MASTKSLNKAEAILNAKSLPGLEPSAIASLQAALADSIEKEVLDAVDAATGTEVAAELTPVFNMHITGATITNPGSGFTSLPELLITGGGGSAADITPVMKAVSGSVVAAGTKYAVGDILTPAGGTGTKATFRVTSVSSVGGVTAISLVDGGAYSVLPTLSAVATTVSPNVLATGCTLNLSMGVGSVTIANAGTGYTSAPTIGTEAGAGSGATATATAKAVTATVNNAGTTGYAPNDVLTVSGGTGTSTTVTVLTTKLISATVDTPGSGGTPGACVLTGTTGTGTKFQIAGTIAGDGTLASVGAISVAGSYTANPTDLGAEPVSATQGLTGAKLNVEMGVDTIEITEAGAYTVLPTLTGAATTGGGTGATVNLVMGVGTVTRTATGSNYAVAPTVVFGGAGGVGSVATANMSGGGVNTVTVTNPGSGYTARPTVSFTPAGGGSGLVITPIMRGSIASVTVSDGGSGYTSEPEVYVVTSTGSGFAVDTVTLASDAVDTVTVDTGGTNYALTDTLVAIGGFPSSEVSKAINDNI